VFKKTIKKIKSGSKNVDVWRLSSEPVSRQIKR
jgi:hypothetical protein